LPIAGASLLDAASAVAEAVPLMARGTIQAAKQGGVARLDSSLHQHSITVTEARAEAADIPVKVVDFKDATAADFAAAAGDTPLVGVVVSNPGSTGRIRDLSGLISAAKEAGALVTVAADLLAQVLVTSPGSLGADIAVGSAQRFGVPLFFG